MDNFEPQNFSERVKLIKDKTGTQKLSELTGISTVQLNRYAKGTSQPMIEPLVAIAEASGVSIQWLATGIGGMQAGSPTVDMSRSVSINFYPDIQPSAGCGNDVVSERSVPVVFDADYLKTEVQVNPKNCVMFSAQGDSMAPSISSGDLLIVDQSVTRGDSIFVLRLSNDIMVKRLQFLPTGHIKVISDSDAYDDYMIDLQQNPELQVIGRVVWHGGRC
ncbi:MAG: S24 family peptidase [Motiliproteus sp.]